MAAAAAKLAAHAGCGVDVARAALRQSSGSQQAATCLLDSATEAYAANVAEFDPAHGDAVFKHPYIKLLLDVARQRIKNALADQPKDDRWLICVRTYGRAGYHPRQWDLRRTLVRFWKGGEFTAEDTFDALLKAGVDTLEKLAAELKDPRALRKKLTDLGLRVSKIGLERLRTQVTKRPPQLSKKDFLQRSAPAIRQLTLSALEEALGPDAHKRCLIFTSHEDEAFVSGQYAAALEGSPWASRVVAGVKGAHLQVRFIEEAAPLGLHVVVVDDNIETFVVERSVEEAAAKRPSLSKTEMHDKSMRPLSFRSKQPPLGSSSFELSDETELERFVRGAFLGDLQKQKAPVPQVLQALADAKVSTVRELARVLKGSKAGSCGLNDRLKTARKTALKYVYLKKLRKQVDKPLPTRLILVRRQKQKRAKPSKSKSMPELAELICRASEEMKVQGSNLWAVNPSKNHYFLKGAGNQTREKARKTGVFCDFTTSLGLVYGACFGFRVLHDPRRYTRYGQIKDDVERSLRYWHCDGVILRFIRYAVVKNYPRLVGKFKAKKGGISAGSCAEKHEAESQKALEGMLGEFASSYARLAKPGELSSCGLIWRPEGMSKGTKRKAQPSASTSAARPGSGKEGKKAAKPTAQSSAAARPGSSTDGKKAAEPTAQPCKRWRSGLLGAVDRSAGVEEPRSARSDEGSDTAARIEEDARDGGAPGASASAQERPSQADSTGHAAELTDGQRTGMS